MIEDGIKISELTATSTINDEDLIPIVQEEETKSIEYGVLSSKLIETGGSNNNYYIKFDNGILICYGQINQNVGGWTAYGNIYSTTMNINTNFAYPFTSIRSLTAVNNTTYDVFIGNVARNNTTIISASLNRGTGAGDIPIQLGYVAIGIWE